MFLIKNQSTGKRFLVYQFVKVSVFKKKKIIFDSIEYFVVYIDVVNLKLKQEIARFMIKF